MELVTESIFNYHIFLFLLAGMLIGMAGWAISDSGDLTPLFIVCPILGGALFAFAFISNGETRSPEHIVQKNAFTDVVVVSDHDRGAQDILTKDYKLKLINAEDQVYRVDGKEKECSVKAVTSTRVEAICGGEIVKYPSGKK